jgi:magnesium-transporting ATPase (P-type)
VTPGLLVRAYAFLGTFEAIAAMAAFFFVLLGAGWQWGEYLSADDLLYRQATTACLTAIVLMQVANVYVCRSRRKSIVDQPLFENRLIIAGIIVELAVILGITYTAPGNAVFGTAPTALRVWLFILPFAAGLLMLEEGRKAIVRAAMRGVPRHPRYG